MKYSQQLIYTFFPYINVGNATVCSAYVLVLITSVRKKFYILSLKTLGKSPVSEH